jgi:hypothetical protein
MIVMRAPFTLRLNFCLVPDMKQLRFSAEKRRVGRGNTEQGQIWTRRGKTEQIEIFRYLKAMSDRFDKIWVC